MQINYIKLIIRIWALLIRQRKFIIREKNCEIDEKMYMQRLAIVECILNV